MLPSDIERALQLVGELLAARQVNFRIAVIGGSALNLLGLVSRATTDVDILAFGKPPDTRGAIELGPPEEPLPAALSNAAAIVAKDLGLDPHWLNTGPASQWQTGPPPGLEGRVHWRLYGGAPWVGIVDRYDLIFFKLYAAADDRGPSSVHFQDLIALRPTDGELAAAASWVRSQDPGVDFGRTVSNVVSHAQQYRDRLRR